MSSHLDNDILIFELASWMDGSDFSFCFSLRVLPISRASLMLWLSILISFGLLFLDFYNVHFLFRHDAICRLHHEIFLIVSWAQVQTRVWAWITSKCSIKGTNFPIKRSLDLGLNCRLCLKQLNKDEIEDVVTYLNLFVTSLILTLQAQCQAFGSKLI